MFGCQQVVIKTNKDTQSIIEYLCTESNNLYNCATYYARQMYFKTNKIVSGFDLTAQMKTNKHFNAGYASSMQQTCMNVGEAFKSFKQLKTKSFKGELTQKPKPPNYRKPGGLFTVTYPKKWLKLKDDLIRFPLGNQVKAWFGLTEFFIPMPSNLDWETIKEVRILPRNQCFYAEFVYEMKAAPRYYFSEKRVLGIDPGLNNWLTCVSNTAISFIIDGRHIKSMNQHYNKRVSTLKENKPQGFWSKQLAHVTEKRNRQVRDAVNKAARIVVNYCIKNHIGNVVFGWNVGQRQNINLGNKINQKFVQIPTARLKYRIAQLCEYYRIKFVETEESYTSKASFLDNDMLPTIGEKPEGWQPSGKRIKRGLYRTAQGYKINADCNGSANIIRKVAVKLGLVLNGISREYLTAPLKIRLWTL